jgi:hypothetical protein
MGKMGWVVTPAAWSNLHARRVDAPCQAFAIVWNRSEEEIVVYNDVPRRFGESPEPDLQQLVARALQKRGRRRRRLESAKNR